MNRPLLALIFLLFAPVISHAGDPTVPFATDDKEMNAAISAARAKLPHFWQCWKTRANGESDFALKVHLEEKGEHEHIWCVDIKRTDTGITAVVNNEPDSLKKVKFGQRITVREVEISDWVYRRDGKMIGNYTLRPMLRTLPKKEREELESMLGRLP